MADTIRLGDLVIALTRKDVKHAHLSVHPPHGRVSLVAPAGTRVEVARAYNISKLGWIRQQQMKLRGQARETSRQYVTRESHYLWGRHFLLTVIEENARPGCSTRPCHRSFASGSRGSACRLPGISSSA